MCHVSLVGEVRNQLKNMKFCQGMDEEPTENLWGRMQEKMCKCDFIVGVASRPLDRKNKWMMFAKGRQNTKSVKVGSMRFEYLG